ncbi:hypothetical protein Z517_09602 [Fonsecaea pedrosoi CBS 271.37]|uniref:Enoyl reductase (ER) domain-containing protein n=1 Tax=Fonsecaea pedrosoi CBS 271.37 TaxID=1442368 RepID=A0A0D2DHJ8_9EURO|nr:uncharacterized protein Z517_09602 [Fonsecaea pedrosoi CBS 271.37]KIW77156.1 hypothetical protein Z517_09602 [Fonsecaea pedrosoi CBS 271.37]
MSNPDTPRKMRAAVFQEACASNGNDEILVKVASASLCGSDLIVYRGYLGPPAGRVGGHEAVGPIVQVGNSVNGFKVGDRVGFLNCLTTCEACTQCLAGQQQFCESGKINQGFDTNGFFAEYARVKALFAVKIPDGLPLERLSPLFCAGITAFRALKQLVPLRAGVIGVFGLGGVGVFAVRFAKALGYQVLGFDVSTEAREAAHGYGIDATVDGSDANAVSEALAQFDKSAGLDGAIVAAGVPAAYQAAINYTGFNGTIVAVGVPHTDVSITILQFVKKNLRLQGTQSGTPLELKEMMQLVQAHSIIPDVDLSPLDALPELVDALATGKITRKVGVVFDNTQSS